MNLYVVVDMECISGVTSADMIRVGSPDWASRGRHLATSEVNVVIEGALAGGAAKIYVQDAHDSGDNILREDLHPAAHLISGAGAVAPLMPGFDGSFGAVFLIGLHARMGTHLAHFDHTVTTATISEIRLNGFPVGEIGLYGAFAGLQDVPVAYISGDVAAVSEAYEIFGDIEAVSVKEAYGRVEARVLSPQETHPIMREAAKMALEHPGNPWKIETPLHVAVDFLRSAEADMAEMVPGTDRTKGRTVEYRHEDPKMSFKALQAMIRLGGIASRKWARALYAQKA